MTALRRAAAWQHRTARSGFEVVFIEPIAEGHRFRGCTTAVEDGTPWVVEYEIDVDASWRTRTARVAARSAEGSRQTLLEADGSGRWRVEGEPAPQLDGCLDVDLESSALTNALPVHRMGLPVGGQAGAPAAYVRALGLHVERLEQAYRRDADDGARRSYEYTAPAFDFSCRIVYDEWGLVLDYPGIALRSA